MKFDILHTFISPVTGRVLCPKDYVLLGDKFGVATPSPILIDLRLDFNNLRQHYNILRDASFVIGFPNTELENAQVLQKLDNGFMFNNEGIVEIKTSIDPTQYLTLTHKKLWIGDENNKPEEKQRIEIDNLPTFFSTSPSSLGGAYNLWTGSANPLKLGEPTTTVALQRCNLPDLTVGKFWIGKEVSITEDPLNYGSNRPVEVDKLPFDNMSDLTKGHFWLGDGNNRPQDTGLLYKNLIIGTQDDELGFRETIYQENLPDLTRGWFWMGDGDGRPQQTGLLYKNLIIGTQDNELGFREKIYIDNLPDLTVKKIWRGDVNNRAVESDDLTNAENKITQIQETITEIQGQIAEIQAEIAAIQVEIAGIQAEITIIQGQITAIEAALAIIQGQIVAIFSAIAGLQLRLDSLRMEGFIESDPAVNNVFQTRRGPTCLLKNIPAGGDVDFGNYRIFNLATFSASTWTEMEDKAQDGINFLFLWQLFGGGVR